MANQFRNFILTINNPEKEDNEIAEEIKGLPHLKYFIFQREKGEEKGTPHIQLYIEFSQGKRFDQMKRYFPTAHIESRKGSKTQAREYCSKKETRAGDVFEFGTFAEERERSDWTDILAMIADGATNAEIREAYPSQFLRYYRAIEDNREMLISEKFAGKRRTEMKVTYIFGNAGVGKTSYVLDTFGDDNVFRMTDYGSSHNIERFDGYCGQDVLLFDEFRSQIAMSSMLNYLDIYPLQLPARFHNKTACYTKVFIVSNVPLCEQYPNIQRDNPTTWQAFLRRLHEVYNFNESKTVPLQRGKWCSKDLSLLKPLTDEQTSMLPF